jgi:large subunit ribosomal protein L10
MPPRIRLRPGRQLSIPRTRSDNVVLQYRHASVAAAVTPAPSAEVLSPVTPMQRYPPTQPPSYKPPEVRKSQLHRQYASLLRSSPLVLIFQHNNLTANEMMAMRRELAKALRKLDESEQTSYADSVKMSVVQTGIFAAALRVVESGFFDMAHPTTASHHPTDPRSTSSAVIPDATPTPSDPAFQHEEWT